MQYTKILIVDDDKDSILLVKKVLSKLDSVKLLEASNGFDAIDIIYEERPELILLDIRMPGLNGYEVCRQIKTDPLLMSTIVIFMTAVSQQEIDDQIIQVRGDDLLRKPLDASELFFRIKSYLSLLPNKKNNFQTLDHLNVMEISNLCKKKGNIDLGEGFFYEPIKKSICKDNNYIPLMHQEILLLEAFIHNKSRILPYDDLLDVISLNGESSLANLRTLIKLLRRKTYKNLIKNLHSIGYQLNSQNC